MESLQIEIKEKLKNKNQPFAIFDFDNTCIVNDIGEATFAYVCRNKLFKDKNLIVHSNESEYHEAIFKEYYRLYKSGNIKEAYQLNAKMFSDFTPAQAEEVTRAAIKTEGTEIGDTELYGISIAHGLAPRPRIIELMQFLKTHGVEIWVMSASVEIAVKTAMDYFGISAKLIGVRGEIENGVFTPLLQTPMPVIEGKVECLRKYIHQNETPLLVIDDSTTGLPILETGDIKVVVNRNNALTKEAQLRGWYLI